MSFTARLNQISLRFTMSHFICAEWYQHFRAYLDFVVDFLQHGDIDGSLADRLDLKILLLQIRESDFDSISIDDFAGENFVITDD